LTLTIARQTVFGTNAVDFQETMWWPSSDDRVICTKLDVTGPQNERVPALETLTSTTTTNKQQHVDIIQTFSIHT
jgi:hypothetical protein